MLSSEKAGDQNWWLRANFYSLYIDAFAGDIPNLINNLDYFETLGIDCLHILPHYPSPLFDDGFDVTDHTGVRKELGTITDFKNLCDEAHKRGIRIMVDLILNHVSIEHPWFVEARQSKDNPKRDYFLWSDTGEEYSEAANIFSDFKPSNWIRNEATNDFYYATFKPEQPELNWNNPNVLKEMLKIVDTLISQGVDGFRLDAIMNLVEVDNTSSVGVPETHERIKDVRRHLDTNHKGVILLGEIIGTTDYSRDYFGNSDECHLSYNFELMAEMLYSLRAGGKKDRLKTVVEAARVIPPQTSWMAFLRNHDSVTLSTLDAERQAELLQLLDPNRTYGFSHGKETVQRLWNLCNEDEAIVREAFSMLYAIPSATVMYYGDEIGMKNRPLPQDEDDMRYVVRAPFDWEEANRQLKNPDSLLHFVATCIKKRI